jgi:formylglycine-generating enzyme required for sulfatase activity
MGQSYGRINKRRGSGAWQWLVIGFFPGLLCGGLVVFLLLLGGVFQGFSAEPETQEVTREVQIVQVVTATNNPDAVAAVQIITATPEPTTEQEPVVILATATPVTVIESTATTVVEATNPEIQSTAVEDTTSQDVPTTSVMPAELEGIVSVLVTVNGGTFQMGTDSLEILAAAQACINEHGGQCDPQNGEDSTPQMTVELSSFQIEQTEVNFAQYVAFLNWQNSQGNRHTTGCSGFLCIQTQNERADAAVIAFDGANYFVPRRLENLETHPAYGVTWYGAQAYCEAIGRRLPTEAEWEYAARSGGQNAIYPWGNNFSLDFANVRVPAIQAEGQTTAPVDAYSIGANGLGLLNMAGNVAEWVSDWYDPTYYQTQSNQQQADGEPIVNPRGPAGGTQRVLRGGSFNGLPFFARTVHRQNLFPAPDRLDETYPLWVGFRCAADGNGATALQSSSSTAIDPASLGVTVPSTGDSATNAQPTVAVPPEAQSTEDAERG